MGRARAAAARGLTLVACSPPTFAERHDQRCRSQLEPGPRPDVDRHGAEEGAAVRPVLAGPARGGCSP